MLFKLSRRIRCAFVVTQNSSRKVFGQYRSGRALKNFVLICAIILSAAAGRAQISKANLILLNQGLQIQGLIQSADFFNLTTYTNANYTSLNWFFPFDPTVMAPVPGIMWSRWANDPTQMPPQDGEDPYTNYLLSLEMSDEPNLNDTTIRNNTVNWFTSIASNYPNTILYVNNYGGQASDSALGDFITRGHPDMLCFDTYPFTSQYNTNYSNNIGPANSWPYTSWFGDLWRYRQWGLNASIPVACYRQTFHSVEDYDQTVYRYPSASETRFNTFSALAFNCKWLIDFVYNPGATTLFDILPNGYSGDTYTNANYVEMIDINRRARNLGRSLVCLKPVHDLHNPNDANPPPGPASGNVNFPDGLTTGMLILKGNPTTSSNTPEPVGFADAPGAPKSYSWWESDKNDPYLRGWAVTNKGINNGGVAGQVIISWFTPIDERLDGSYSNEVYFMVVNALTAPTGSAADCLQDIRLNFLNTFTNVVMLDPETGLLQTNALPIVSTRRQLTLLLNGGDAALFKISDGAPFVGHVPPVAAQLSATPHPGNLSLNIQGTPGACYQVQSKPSLAATNWTTLTNLTLLSSPTSFQGPVSVSNAYYRVVGIP